MWIRSRKKSSGGGGGLGVTLTVQCSSDLAGNTVTCTDGEMTLTDVCPSSSPYNVEFTLNSSGVWTVSTTKYGQVISDTYTIESTGTLKLMTTPDGATVTPTDDVSILLQTASVFDKNYTTMPQLLADTSTLETVMHSNNAVDYLVRSTTFISSVTSDANAMSDIGSSNYASNTLLNDSTWLTGIANSQYFTSILNDNNPYMTGLKSPSGTIDSPTNASEAPNAFDNDINTEWGTAQNVQYDITYAWASGKSIKPYIIKMRYHQKDGVSSVITFSGYTGSRWISYNGSFGGESTSSVQYKTLILSNHTPISTIKFSLSRGIGGVSEFRVYGRKNV